MLMFTYILMILSVTVDCLIVSLIYSAGSIKIPIKSAVIISVIGTLSLCISMAFSNFAAQFLPYSLCRKLSFLTLLAIGVISLFQSALKKLIKKYSENTGELHLRINKLNLILKIYADETAADFDCSKELNTAEAVSLAAALSLDSLAIGFSSGLSSGGFYVILFVFAASIVLHIAALLAGFFIGRTFFNKIKFDLSPLSGIFLIIFAFLRII